jgi:hypothetical protein
MYSAITQVIYALRTPTFCPEQEPLPDGAKERGWFATVPWHARRNDQQTGNQTAEVKLEEGGYRALLLHPVRRELRRGSHSLSAAIDDLESAEQYASIFSDDWKDQNGPPCRPRWRHAVVEGLDRWHAVLSGHPATVIRLPPTSGYALAFVCFLDGEPLTAPCSSNSFMIFEDERRGPEAAMEEAEHRVLKMNCASPAPDQCAGVRWPSKSSQG